MGISIEKVQTFLYEVIQAQMQERQTEQNTLRWILDASHEISDIFQKNVDAAFPQEACDRKQLLYCSGQYVFSCSMDEEELKKRLNSLFLQYYKNFQGQVMFRYAYFLANGWDDIGALQEMKRQLKAPGCLNSIIERNEEVLFSFQKTFEKTSVTPQSHEGCAYYAEEIADLNAPADTTERDNSRFRVAVIKADLDGMGDLFKQIRNMEEYNAVSRILNKWISPQGFHEVLRQYAEAKTPKLSPCHFKVFPLYFAGDDLFFLVPMKYIVTGVKLCQKLLDTINTELRQKCSTLQQNLRLRIGIEVTFSNQPIRYYYERTNHQMELGQAAEVNAETTAINESLKCKITFNGFTFFDVDMNNISREAKEACKKLPIWNHLLHNIRVLNYVKSKALLDTTSFYYGLLERITDPQIHGDPRKLSNTIFYHIMPESLESGNKDLIQQELKIKYGIAQQLYVLQKIPLPNGRPKNDFQPSFDKAIINKLKVYLQLMILLSDKRFIVYFEDPMTDIDFKRSFSTDLKNIKSRLFLKVIDCYFNLFLANNIGLRNIFVQQRSVNDQTAGGFPDANSPLYTMLRIDTSSFFKIRSILLLDSQYTEKVNSIGKLLSLSNSKTEEDIREINEKRKAERAKQPSNILFFDLVHYERQMASLAETFTVDYVDALLIFFSFKKLLGQLNAFVRSN